MNTPSEICPLTASAPPRPNTPSWPSVGSACSVGVRRALNRAARSRCGVEPPGGVAQPARLAVLLPEALDDADAGDGLLDVLGDLGGALLRGPRRREQASAHARGEQDADRQDDHRRDREQRREPQHDPDRDDQLPERARHQRDHPQQALDLLQVGVGARDDLPGAQGVLLGPVEARDRAEHAPAQVVLDPEREAAPEVAAQEGGAEADDGDDGHRDHQRAEARGGAGDGAVDRRADQQRSDGLEADAQHRGREGGHGERGAAPAVARETSHPATGAAGRHVLTRGDVLGGALRGALRRSGGGREVSSQIRTAPRQAARSRTPT